MPAKFFIQTMGCQMNRNDSERIAGLLIERGMKPTDNPRQADVLIINSCSVRQASEDKVVGTVKNWNDWKKSNPNMIIAVSGCMAGRDKDGKLRKKMSAVDIFFQIDDLPRLPAWLGELNPNIFTGKLNDDLLDDYLGIAPERENSQRAFITIQTGCNNYCTYCVVPFARGRERNRPVQEILHEAREFAENGLEITLLGQVVNHYIAPDPENFSMNNPYKSHDHFAALLWELNQIEKIERIHFTAPDPQYFNDAQISALNLPKQVNYLHLPAQSGDDEILRKMNRKCTREKYIELIKKIRSAKPDIAIGTDLIVGFCGETKEQFENTMDLYRECDFDIAYLAMYSERSGTAAAKAFKDDVPRAEKKRRWNAMQNLMEKTVLKKNQKYVGKIVEVIADKCADGLCSGNSREMKFTQFIGTPDLVDKIVKVKIFEAKEWVLKGELI
ncbi:MAG: tRNA (N6-isopentenyl adenosine(37)-C2)-methylthiotransferase MiaB [Patescibacteria group bacterium]